MKKTKYINLLIYIIIFTICFLFCVNNLNDIQTINVQGNKEIKEIKEESAPAPIEENKEKQKKLYIKLQVPFTPQAPNANWKDPRQENGCEETASLMAMYWVNDKQIDKDTIEKEITDISDFEQKKYNNYVDTSSEDVVKRIFNDYFGYYNVETKYDITIDDIISELKNGNLILVPTNGQKLNNPFYTAPGPERHELVITGYDESTDEFITNDPGTKHGKDYRYKTNILYNAIYDYKTGDNEPVDKIIKAMIVVSK